MKTFLGKLTALPVAFIAAAAFLLMHLCIHKMQLKHLMSY